MASTTVEFVPNNYDSVLSKSTNGQGTGEYVSKFINIVSSDENESQKDKEKEEKWNITSAKGLNIVLKHHPF